MSAHWRSSCATLGACLALLVPLQAGFIHVWGVGEIEDAAALVTGTVLAVRDKGPVQTGSARSKPPEHHLEASIEVHRAHSLAPLPRGSVIAVHYLGDFGPTPRMGIIWPGLTKGMTAIFPLKSAGDGQWQLLPDQGMNVTVPALVVGPPAGSAATTGRGFILSELANTLAHGTPELQYEAAAYLRQANGVIGGFREALARAAGTDEDRWLGIAAALLASRGTPQASVRELMADPSVPGANNELAGWALQMGAQRDFPNRLIHRLLRNQSDYDWGAANALLGFKDSPVLLAELKALLIRDPKSSIYTAHVLVRNGQRTLLPEALAAAVPFVRNPKSVSRNTLFAATSLLRDFGSDAQFEVFLATLRRLRFEDEDSYRTLFSSVHGLQHRRELRAAAILIDDRRFGFGTLRYCDVAAGIVKHFSGDTSEIVQAPSASERDRMVARSRAWLAANRGSI